MENVKKFVKRYWIWIGVAVVLIVIGVIMYRQRQARLKREAEEAEKKGTNSVNTTKKSNEATFPLRPYDLVGEYSLEKGSMGNQIKVLQGLINKADAYTEKLDEDGKYGSKTLAAFKSVWSNLMAGNGTITEAQYNQIIEKSYIK